MTTKGIRVVECSAVPYRSRREYDAYLAFLLTSGKSCCIYLIYLSDLTTAEDLDDLVPRLLVRGCAGSICTVQTQPRKHVQ